MMWVIDTSALVRLFVPDGPVHPEAEAAFNRAASGADLLMAPQLLLAETANVLMRKRRRGELSSPELRELLQAVESLPIRYFEHQPLLIAACALAEDHELTFYDALYLALAERHGARLLTCDAELDKVARAIGLSPG